MGINIEKLVKKSEINHFELEKVMTFEGSEIKIERHGPHSPRGSEHSEIINWNPDAEINYRLKIYEDNVPLPKKRVRLWGTGID